MTVKIRNTMVLVVCGLALTVFGFVQSAKADEPPVCTVGSEVSATGPIFTSGDIATGTFTVAPGCENVRVTLASYKFPSASEMFPQVRFDESGGTFNAGESFILRVNLPSCSYQVDLVAGDSLSTLATDTDYGSHLLTTLGGASTACGDDNQPTCTIGTDAIIDHSLVLEDGVATGTFSIAKGCEDIQVSLASYQATAATYQLPQTLFDSATGTFDAGGPYTLQADVDDCYYQIDLVYGPVIVNLSDTSFYGNKKVRFENGGTQACEDDEIVPPTFPNCMDLLNNPGDIAHYTSGLHQIAGGGLLEGADDVYAVIGGNAVQCFCPPTGMGTQTNWWQTDTQMNGWLSIGNGLSWNLGDHNYLALNSEFDCHGDVGGEESGANITVNKVVVNDNGGTAVASDFLLKVGQAVVTNGVLATNFSAGTYQVVESEGPLSGYTATFSGDCDAQGNITMAAGQTYTCTITNNDVAPPVPTFPNCMDLLHNVGDIAHYSSGLHQIAGGALMEGADNVYAVIGGNAVQCFCPPNGTGIQTNWWQTDAQMTGWLSIGNGLSWNLGDHNYLALNSEFDCTPDQGGGGGSLGANITVTKVVINDNQGTAVASDFLLKVGQAVVTNGVLATNFTAGTYQVTESEGPLSGYTATFSGDCDAQGNITMVAGHSYTCTITNNDNAPATSGGGGGGGGSSTTTTSSGGGGGGCCPAPVTDNTNNNNNAPAGLVLGTTTPPAEDVSGDLGGVAETPVGGVAAGKSFPLPLLFAIALILIGAAGVYLTKNHTLDLN